MEIKQEELRMIVGRNIRYLRMKRKMTQKDLAEAARVTYKYLQAIEGKNPPNMRLDTLARLKKALETKIGVMTDEVRK